MNRLGRRAPATLAGGLNELAKLRAPRAASGEIAHPDYNHAGTPMAYAFAYLAHRISGVAAITALELHDRPPRRVLDIGSGADTTRIALELLYPDAQFNILTVEPSRRMMNLGMNLVSAAEREAGTKSAVTRRRVGVRLDEIYAGRLPRYAQHFDLVVASACLPYKFDSPQKFAHLLLNRCAPGGRIVVVEPRAKADILDAVAHELKRALGTPILIRTSSCWEEQYRARHVLQATTILYGSLFSAMCASDVLDRPGRKLAEDIAGGVLSRLPDRDVFVVARRPGLPEYASPPRVRFSPTDSGARPA